MSRRHRKLELPKDLGVKIVPKEQARWEQLKTGALEQIEQSKVNIECGEVIVKLAEEKLKTLASDGKI